MNNNESEFTKITQKTLNKKMTVSEYKENQR